MKTSKTLTVIITIFLLIVTSGCAQHTVTNPDGSTITTYELDKNTVGSYVVPITAVIGGGLGQIIGQDTKGTLTGGAIGTGAGLILKWLSRDNNSQQAKQWPQSQTQATNNSEVIVDYISPSSRRLGMYQNGDKVFVKTPIQSNGQFFGNAVKHYQMKNKQWIEIE